MFTKEMAIALLQQKQAELCRLPKKSDFTDDEVARIKSRLGPWPRALEAAGLKEKNETGPGPSAKRRGRAWRQKRTAQKKQESSKQTEKES